MKASAEHLGHTASNTVVMKKAGKKPIKFKKGGLHKSTGTPMGKKIPAEKREEAREGKFGKKAQKQEEFAENVLKH